MEINDTRPESESLNVPSQPVDAIRLRNLRGSIQHYFHFFLGGFVPLVHYLAIRRNQNPIHIRNDVGSMLRIIRELPVSLAEVGESRETVLRGFDAYLDNDLKPGGINRMTPEIRSVVLTYLEDNTPAETADQDYPRIVLIQRDHDAFFQTDKAEVKSSGAERRSIANQRQVQLSLEKEFGDRFQNIILENREIFSQYQLFRRADLVIGQHGAALANIFFMSPGSRIVEICPPLARKMNMFANLAKQCGIRYQSLEQETNHAPVAADRLLSICQNW